MGVGERALRAAGGGRRRSGFAAGAGANRGRAARIPFRTIDPLSRFQHYRAGRERGGYPHLDGRGGAVNRGRLPTTSIPHIACAQVEPDALVTTARPCPERSRQVAAITGPASLPAVIGGLSARWRKFDCDEQMFGAKQQVPHGDGSYKEAEKA
jgi:hypothetical protein